jgi:uncharacterized protein (TIRG00374 family)
MRKTFLVIVLILAAVFIIFSFSELESILKTIEHSDWRFIGLALIIETVWLYNLATTFRALYRLVGLEEDSRHLMLVAAAANFINVVAPSAGIGGIAVFIDDAKQRNHASGRVTVVGALFVLFDYIAFLCVLAQGWVVLIRRNNLNAGEITASIILLSLAVAFAVMLYLGYRSAAELSKALAWMARAFNRVLRPFLHRDYLSVERAYTFADEIAEGLSAIRGKRKELLWPFLFALNNKVLLICVLALTFLAFQTPFTVGTLVGGFSIGYLFLIVSPTPAGLGFVEGALTLALNSLRVQLGTAGVITLIYRAITFWYPLGVGALALRALHRQPKEGDR